MTTTPRRSSEVAQNGCGIERGAPTLPWFWSRKHSIVIGALLCLLLLLAEHHSPSRMLFDSDGETQIANRESGQTQRQIAYLAIGVIGILSLRGRDRAKWNDLSPLARTAAALGAWCVLSVLWSEDPYLSARRLAVLALMLVGALGLSLSWRRTTIVTFIAIISAIHISIGLFSEIALGAFTPLDGEYRFAGTLHWNEQAAVCLMLTLSSLTALQIRLPRRPLFTVLLVYGAGCLFLTKSRGAMIGLALALAVFIFLAASKRARVKVLLSAGAIVVFLFATGLVTSVEDTLSRKGEGVEDFTGRGPLWDELITYGSHHLLTGHGYDAFWNTERIDAVSEEFHWAIDSSHSGYLESFLTIGLVGMLLHVATLVLGLVQGMALYRRTKDVTFAFAAAICVYYLAVGSLESLLLIKPSAISFFVTLLLCSLAVPRQDCVRLEEPGEDRRIEMVSNRQLAV